MEKMVDWVHDNVPSEPPPSILEVGSGNGALLCALLEAGYDPRSICGIDYSADAVKLARDISATRKNGQDHITYEVCDFLKEYPQGPGGRSPTALSDEFAQWDLVLDKGTFDAIALAEKDSDGNLPADVYPPRIAEVIKPGGYFLIVCKLHFLLYEFGIISLRDSVQLYGRRTQRKICIAVNRSSIPVRICIFLSNNESEVMWRISSRIPFATFSFGGHSGNVYSSVAFQKPV